MAAKTATAAFDATARTSDRRDGAGCPSPHLWWGARDERRLTADDGRPAGGERPAALLEPRPQERDRRHTGVGFELVLDPVVPQLGHELVDVPTVVSQPEFEQHSAEHNVDIPVRGDRSGPL